MFRRLLLAILALLLVLLSLSARGQIDYSPRGVISASYCYSFDTYNYFDISANYYVYYLTFLHYPVSYLDVFGGISYKTDETFSDTQFGYMVGISWTVLFVNIRPTYTATGFLTYRDYSSCYAFGGINYPLWWEGQQIGGATHSE